jgi:2-C-methyl-D-erythritol 4-phosphate cytidylyltransferase
LKTVAIIVGGGQGKRIKGKLPKQFLSLRGKPILVHTVEKFERCKLIDEIILVVPEDYMSYCSQAIVDKFGYGKVKKIVCGGRERQDSVYQGLKACPKGTSTVAIHDAVRPLISPNIISQSIKLCLEKKAVVVAVPPKDTIKRGEEGLVVTTLNRDKMWLIQTPQVFEYKLILDAHQKAKKEGFWGTDDSILVERLGKEVAILEGEFENIKITTAEDLAIAETLLQLTKEKN